MAVKSKRGRKTQKSSVRHKRRRGRAISRRRRVSSKRRRANCMRGGNYETDVTTRTLEGYPMKPANQVVTTVPGYGTMTAAAYIKLKEDQDRNGNDLYD
jgi:hypothetical protein